jgi:hypothetical protein
VPRTRRESTDPASHHGFLDSLDGSAKRKTKQNRRRQDDDEEPLDLDRIL